MTDKDRLEALYKYIKLIAPNAKVSFRGKMILVGGSCGSYLEIYCKNNRFAAQSCDFHCDWIHKIFKMYRVSLDKVRDIIPNNVIIISCNRYYALNPRNDEIFK